MVYQQTNNKNIRNYLNEMNSRAYAEMTYEGKPLPEWLQVPAFAPEPNEMKEEIPSWLQEPVVFS